jgi:hypothetical protein
MKIENSTINLSSQRAISLQVTVEESLRAWIGKERPDFEGRAPKNAPPPPETIATISAAGSQACACAEAQNDPEQKTGDPKMIFLIGLIEALTGQKIRLFDASDLKSGDAASAPPQQTSAPTQTPDNQRHGWGIEYDRHETRHESEQTTFAAQGVVKTADGKEIHFDLKLEMQREFFQETDVSIRKGDGVKKDPLAINFNGTAAQLTDTKFSFDLDSDGKTEQMSFVGSGSGFLALDKNNNGVIDNGSELFGAQSGNGFADLAAYDSDGNNWIDENDSAFAKLMVWSKDAAGKDSLDTLIQRNVGALYLGNIGTSFELKDAGNTSQGQVRSSGMYLNEDGSAGTLQQVDLVV